MAIASEGKWVWFDYLSPDVDKAAGFYTSLFGWKTRASQSASGTYTMLRVDDDGIGGVVPTPSGAPPRGHWIPYLATGDIRTTLDRVGSLGGSVLRAPLDNGDFGTLAIVADPLGGYFALWQSGRPSGDGDFKGKPSYFVWNELYTPDPAASIAFYAGLTGCSERSMTMNDGGTYHILERDGRGRAGVMKPPAPDGASLPMPQQWMPYVQVASCDDAIAKAKQLGANVHVVEDAPGVGRFGIFSDPLGGMLGVMQPAR